MSKFQTAIEYYAPTEPKSRHIMHTSFRKSSPAEPNGYNLLPFT